MKNSSFARLARAFSSYPMTPTDLFCVGVYNVSSRRKLVNLTFYLHAVDTTSIPGEKVDILRVKPFGIIEKCLAEVILT